MTRTLLVFVVVMLACSAILAQSDESGRTPPVPIYQVQPVYTEEARAAKISGSVTIRMLVGADGVPSEARVIKSLDRGLDQSALEAVSQWRFKPATQDGEAIAFEATIEIGFKLL